MILIARKKCIAKALAGLKTSKKSKSTSLQTKLSVLVYLAVWCTRVKVGERKGKDTI